MTRRIKSFIKNNKTTILISSVSSIVTVFVAATVFTAMISTGFISISGAGTTQTGTIKTDLVAEESTIIDVVKKANPAVVSIVITKDLPAIERYYQQYDPFGGSSLPSNNQDDSTEQTVGGGSGFFVTSDGYVVTNCHVVEDSSASYTVVDSDGKKYTAKILAKDPTMDVAILKVSGKNFKYLTFGDSDKIKLGQTAIAIGNALAEYQNSISKGIISGLSRSITASDTSGNTEQLEGVIQTDAAINLGNSGGPLLDIRGNVIGVNVAIDSEAENISFALPGNMVKNIAESVIKTGAIVKPYLGVRYTQVTDSIVEKNNLSVDYGAIVMRGSSDDELAVIPGSPADKAGIVENDIILSIDGVKLDGSHSLVHLVRQKQIGQTVNLTILHDGKQKNISVKLEKAPSNL